MSVSFQIVYHLHMFLIVMFVCLFQIILERTNGSFAMQQTCKYSEGHLIVFENGVRACKTLVDITIFMDKPSVTITQFSLSCWK